MRARGFVLLFLLAGAICFLKPDIVCGESWIRTVSAVTDKYEPFILHTIASENGHLIATATYGDYRDGTESGLPSTIEGVETKDCKFWPRVTASVANDLDGPWESVSHPQKMGEPATFTLQAHSQNVVFFLDLGVFRVGLGRWRYGRLTLQNGHSAIFEMLNAQMPVTRSSSNRSNPDAFRRWSEVLVHREPDPLIKLPFVISEISSDGDQLQAICSYVEKNQSSPTSLDGVKTADGKFWPNAVAQVANDYNGVWITVGELTKIGQPTTLSIEPKDVKAELYVNLKVFRPMIGKFRYGRLVLGNGNAACFELYKLLPREKGSTSDARE